jgi:hypothetical protein
MIQNMVDHRRKHHTGNDEEHDSREQRVHPASHFPASVRSGSTGPMPPSSIAAFKKALDQGSPSTQW